MRTKSVIQGFKNSQKIRVIIDGVGIYMTVGETTSRFATTVHYQAVESTLHLMAREGCDGIGHRIGVYDFNMHFVQVDVQVDILR
jgi:hypothetical protein